MPVVLLNAPRACILMGVFNSDDGVIEITWMYFMVQKWLNLQSANALLWAKHKINVN